MPLTRIKHTLKSKFAESRPSSKGRAFDIVNPARLFQWAIVLRRVRHAYLQAHEGRRLCLARPERYTDKMQWRKLFDLNPIYSVITDKLAVRNFVASRVNFDILVPLLWSGADPTAIPLDAMDPPYVVKSTHASGHVLLVKDKRTVDADTALSTFKKWLTTCYGTENNEPGYIQVPRRLLVERMLLCVNGRPPIEHRFFAFEGAVRFVQTTYRDADGPHHGAFLSKEWEPLDWYLRTPNRPELFSKPKRLTDMIEIAERLAKGFDHMRVDMYEADDEIWFGELTPYSWSGLTMFVPDEADKFIGSFWVLRRPMRRALNAFLCKWWKISRPQ
jgi:TupA-like ATPgrasp